LSSGFHQENPGRHGHVEGFDSAGHGDFDSLDVKGAEGWKIHAARLAAQKEEAGGGPIPLAVVVGTLGVGRQQGGRGGEGV
jgi:hypothetical protein